VSQQPTPRSVDDFRPRVPLAALILVISAAMIAAAAPGPAPGQSQKPVPALAQAQATYATPEAALSALVTAVEAKNRPAMDGIFGPDASQLFSGDPAEDNRNLDHFAASLRASAKLQKDTHGGYTILVGNKGWPFPIPIVRQNDRWLFDTKAGLNEILNRRIGEDELSAIATCRAYVVAQWEYYTASGADHDGLAVYAQRFVSLPGHHDGLYWPAGSDEKASPMGELVAAAGVESQATDNSAQTGAGQIQSSPYHGYYFRILTRQGPSAPGGKFAYVINGNMIAGYALVAWPARWGNTGVMTFIVNQQGRVYQKNLGPDTAKIAAAMTEYNPDPTWQLVEP
jgi:Protein of unknown function (DUF2950)